MPCTLDYAKNHGIYNLDSTGFVKDILYKASLQEMQNYADDEKCVPLVCGIVFLSRQLSEDMLYLYTQPPLDACTYMGLDSGAQPLQLSLFFDFLLPMCSGIDQTSFVNHLGASRYGNTSVETSLYNQARVHLWHKLNGYKLKAITLNDGHHSYMDSSARTHRRHLSNYSSFLSSLHNQALGIQVQNITHSCIKNQKADVVDATIINSIIDQDVLFYSDSVISHCDLTGLKLSIKPNCVLSGIESVDFQDMQYKELPENLFLQAFHINLPGISSSDHRVITLFGSSDELSIYYMEPEATMCNIPWTEFLKTNSLSPEDLWLSNIPEQRRCLRNARLYPVAHPGGKVSLKHLLWMVNKDKCDMNEIWRSCWRMSLEEILTSVNHNGEFNYRRKLFYKIGAEEIHYTLMEGKAQGLTELFEAACIDGYQGLMLETLDIVAVKCNSAGIAARALATIADVLGSMSRGYGGMRSGPANNSQWKHAFHLLEDNLMVEGINELAQIRQMWLDRADLQVRAARHYSGAAQILIRKAVMSARKFIKLTDCPPLPMMKWIKAEAPARADLSGGWSDTPPITYEHGGAVTNLALMIDNKKPIGAKARRIPELILRMQLGNDEEIHQQIEISELYQLSDYTQVHAPGALLKAAFICSGIIEYPSSQTLAEQLLKRHGGGFELVSWSNLPHGSGMGTSSILAGAILAALWKVSGKSYDSNSLIHAVLHLEQILTTGGGWQDQVGGLVGGAKIGHSHAQLPLQVQIQKISISEEMLSKINKHMVLVYTGKTRLAKNLLQNVLRNWYARDTGIMHAVDSLIKNAWKCADALKKEDLIGLGSCLDEYWQLKKQMAPGCEPTVVTRMLEKLRPLLHGASLAGAGGGGFMYLLLKQSDNAVDTVTEILKSVPGAEHVAVHSVRIDEEGLRLTED